MTDILKTGASSIIIGCKYYKGRFPCKLGKLLKITKISPHHNELETLSIIRNIRKSSKYYSIPVKEFTLLEPSDSFYKIVERLVKDEKMTIFDTTLHCFYIDYAGKDVQSTINDIMSHQDFSIWSSYNVIMKFTKQMIKALSYLHDHKLCHLDVKAENIMYDSVKKRFRLIDFGFSDVYPFKTYVNCIRCTLGYFPESSNNFKITEWFPKICANDMIQVNGNVPMQKHPEYVYKIDSFCLGRTLYFLTKVYDMNRVDLKQSCFIRDKNSEDTVKNITKLLLNNDVRERVTIKECRLIFNI